MARIPALLVAIVVVVALFGCAGQGARVRGDGDSGAGGERSLPEWVRMVHPRADGRDIYVGGCSMASGPGQSVELAMADAFSQMTERSRSDFTRVFAGATRESGIETTSFDRLDFRERGLELYADYVTGAARLDRVYFQDCETGRAYEELPDHWAGGPVCRTFAELSVDSAAWGRLLEESVLEMRHEFAKGGRENLVDLADWVISNYETPDRGPNAEPDARVR